jgi:hypothetical protein
MVSRLAVDHPSPRRRAHVKLVSAACEARALSPARRPRLPRATHPTTTTWHPPPTHLMSDLSFCSSRVATRQASTGQAQAKHRQAQAGLGFVYVVACQCARLCLPMSRKRGVQEAGATRVRHAFPLHHCPPHAGGGRVPLSTLDPADISLSLSAAESERDRLIC